MSTSAPTTNLTGPDALTTIDMSSEPHVTSTPQGGIGLRPMGYRPGLDGVRAVSVIAVLLYHAGFSWMHGGFFGVEVFFVVSGFLITSLLLDEHERSGRISLGQFWLRRARRLLPALVLVLAATAIFGAVWGSALMQSDVRRDLPWALGYAANWGQIVGGAEYFGNLSPLRHLWSLAVEEQWYLVWPLVFLVVVRALRRARVRAALLGVLGFAVIGLTWWMARETPVGADRTNFLYLSTLTRSSGLLLGAGAAFVWRPWRSTRSVSGRTTPLLDVAAMGAVAVLAWSFVVAVLTDRAIYRWHLAVVTFASLVLVLVVVHPGSRVARPVFEWRPLVVIGKRSYGLYLWSWPVSVAAEAYDGSWDRFVMAMTITVVLSELSYRFVETPIRKGAIGRWTARHRDRTGHWYVSTTSAAITAVALVAPLALFYSNVEHVDPAEGGESAVFVMPSAEPAASDDPAMTDLSSTVPSSTSPSSPPSTEAPSTEAASTSLSTEAASTSRPASAAAATATTMPLVDAIPESAAASVVPTSDVPPVTAPVLPRRVVVVGDSMAHSLAVNLPDGIEQTFAIENGSVEGCSVYDDGSVRSQRRGFSRSFENCAGWADRWVDAAVDSQSTLALVVIGAWDVFDVEVDDELIRFGTPEGDERFVAGLTEGIDALAAQGVHVALLEIGCMRPEDVDGAGVPALPERGDDARVARLNDAMRAVAAERSAEVTFVSGPPEWCADDEISTDLGYRWDGVHVYKPGANLIYTAIAEQLLTIPL